MAFYTVRYDDDEDDEFGNEIAPRAIVEATTAQQALDRGSDVLDCPIDDLAVCRLKHGEVSVERLVQFFGNRIPIFSRECFA